MVRRDADAAGPAGPRHGTRSARTTAARLLCGMKGNTMRTAKELDKRLAAARTVRYEFSELHELLERLQPELPVRLAAECRRRLARSKNVANACEKLLRWVYIG